MSSRTAPEPTLVVDNTTTDDRLAALVEQHPGGVIRSAELLRDIDD